MKDKDYKGMLLDEIARSRLLFPTLKELGENVGYEKSLLNHNRLSGMSDKERDKAFTTLESHFNRQTDGYFGNLVEFLYLYRKASRYYSGDRAEDSPGHFSMIPPKTKVDEWLFGILDYLYGLTTIEPENESARAFCVECKKHSLRKIKSPFTAILVLMSKGILPPIYTKKGDIDKKENPHGMEQEWTAAKEFLSDYLRTHSQERLMTEHAVIVSFRKKTRASMVYMFSYLLDCLSAKNDPRQNDILKFPDMVPFDPDLRLGLWVGEGKDAIGNVFYEILKEKDQPLYKIRIYEMRQDNGECLRQTYHFKFFHDGHCEMEDPDALPFYLTGDSVAGHLYHARFSANRESVFLIGGSVLVLPHGLSTHLIYKGESRLDRMIMGKRVVDGPSVYSCVQVGRVVSITREYVYFHVEKRLAKVSTSKYPKLLNMRISDNAEVYRITDCSGEVRDYLMAEVFPERIVIPFDDWEEA